MSEWHHDLWSIPTLFTPFRPKNPLSKEIYVAGGFYGLYSDQGPSGQPSMQEQFFSVFDSLPKLQKIETSGHSLGSSFSSLCALDLKAAYPKADIKNTNFASPAVGTENWEDVYNNELGLKSSTFRIYNYWDYVPSMPPLPIFKHVGQPFEINTFVKDSWFPDLVARHSMDNYAYILGKAVKNSPQVWVGDYPDQTDPALTMKSQAPYGVTPPNWAALEIEMKENLPYSKS